MRPSDPLIEYGIGQIAERVHGRLQRYLEAQYHIRNTELIEERRLVLQEPGGISQRPYVEVTPSYAVLPDYAALVLPDVVKTLLQDLLAWEPKIGVYPPFKHQADALEGFFRREDDGDDLIVATGTGSGKTETFLYSILGHLAREASTRPSSFARPGVRALLLYPMNALVSDQTARLRLLLGDCRLAELFRGRWGRHPLFGMYTSRTPYPGVRVDKKNRKTEGLLTIAGYYAGLEAASEPDAQVFVSELKARGRWPAKDMMAFFNDAATQRNAAGKVQSYGIERRFHTHPDDRELLTRDEMQRRAPDLLVTNYSMLEYMLLRPIERPIFTSTREWLAADERNQLLLVLDEAHMYRGVAGAEVGFLIRRLISRLGISRDRLRCILTSASLGAGPDAESAARTFAIGLTGETHRRAFAVVRATRESRPVARVGTSAEAAALATINPAVLAAARVAPDAVDVALARVVAALDWQAPDCLREGELRVRQQVCRLLTGFGPLELLLERVSGNATAFDVLARELFPGVEQVVAERATDGLFALGTFARRTEQGRSEQPLLPTRVHLLYRGLPPLYVCANPLCSHRRTKDGSVGLAGRLYTEPATRCHCGSRVYEVLTHRDCGAAFLRVYGTGHSATFLWHERGGRLTAFGRPLHEIHLLLEEPHPDQFGDVEPVFLEHRTGRLHPSSSAGQPGIRLCYRPKDGGGATSNLTTFGVCPVCTRRTTTGSALKIMDLATKGEQPFANLVREQFATLAPSRPASAAHPNEGRKALLFSDGRQKAARLARDLPREVERDSFREALALAVATIGALPDPIEATLDAPLYGAFVAVCADHFLNFFDGRDQAALLEEATRFRTDYNSDLGLAFDMEWDPVPPTRFRQALLRQIGDPYYSLVAACAGTISIRPAQMRLLQQRTSNAVPEQALKDIAAAWLHEMLELGACDPQLSLDARLDEFPYFTPVRAADGLKRFFDDIGSRAGLDASALQVLREALFDVMTVEAVGGQDAGRLVVPKRLRLSLTLDDTWLQCAECGHLQLHPCLGGCSNCGGTRLEHRPPGHPYMVSRKGYFREPLRAVLAGAKPLHITAEEHTAQLSQRDAGVVYATTEEFELRFQDVPMGSEKPPVDILSCTTTMEVGIDIGALTAVGLRTVPPQRENYQQRAGRSGRRGTSVSSVLTFAQGGAHDAFYFEHPAAMISGSPREPRIKADNRRLATRHIHSYLLQTFFHKQIDQLSLAEQEQLASTRPGIMSALGDLQAFFSDDPVFSHQAFSAWLAREVFVPHGTVIDDLARWLPAGLVTEPDSLTDRKSLVRAVAQEFESALMGLEAEVHASRGRGGSAGGGEADDDLNGSLLDALFGRGMLPSYAFPTDLAAFVIQERGDNHQIRVAERPQLAKAQALSEYAPGRLLVVNKKTYRVGGVFVECAPTSSPARELFAGSLRRYVGCSVCAFVRLENGAPTDMTVEGSPCPVCSQPLFVREVIDPPAFTPEKGRALGEGDRDQDITYASSAQLPELVGRDAFSWRLGPGSHMEHAFGEDIVLVVANKGKDATGFSICEDCGAAWLDGDEPAGLHERPFLLPDFVLAREKARGRCGGRVRRGLFLGHEFRTDLLLLRVRLGPPLDFSPDQPWLYDALATLAEALCLAASLQLDIDPVELSAGFRLLPAVPGQPGGEAEIFLYDTSSGGAGYAADAGAALSAVLARAAELLEHCPANCERSCTRCLRHYGNRFLHDRLDRRLAATLLRYARTGEVPAALTAQQLATVLGPLRECLELEGWTVDPRASAQRPLAASHPSGRRVLVVAYPALLNVNEAKRLSSAAASASEALILLPDYVVDSDLPAAYQRTAGLVATPNNQHGSPTPLQPLASSLSLELTVRELRRPETTHGNARLRLGAQPPAGAFASRVPTGGLEGAGFGAGQWLVLTPEECNQLPTEQWIVLLRRNGVFQATREAWTIARVKFLDEARTRLQVSYGPATGRQCRPEKVGSSEVAFAASVFCAAEEAQ